MNYPLLFVIFIITKMSRTVKKVKVGIKMYILCNQMFPSSKLLCFVNFAPEVIGCNGPHKA